jgi:rhodanese-related sulfurtransferase
VLEHEVREGVPALTAKNARRIALDNWVIAGGPPPMLGGGGRIVVCTCTAGPKSALAVEYLLQFGVDAVAVAGGLKGWDAGGLELVDLFEEDEDDEDEDEDE